jgi:site-specific DNA recombinase
MYDLSRKKGKKCVIYIRVSSERQVKGFSLDGQKRYLKLWAEFEGMEVINVYVEEGKSGKSIEGRDVFQMMINDIESKRIQTDYIVVFKLSRFGRNAKDILNSLTKIQAHGVNLLCKEDGLDSSNAMGKMMITILGAVAEMERENIIAQSMLGREEKAKQGGWNGGFAPYGYELQDGKLIPVAEQSEIVKTIFDKFVNGGMGYCTIAGWLNKQGIKREPAKNSHGRIFTDWSDNQIKRILDNVLYTGRIAYGRRRSERIDGTENESRLVKQEDYIISDCISHEPLVDDELFEKARQKRKATGVKGNPKIGRERAHLLSGILKCPKCGSSMFSDKNMWTNADGTKKETFSYVCSHYRKSRNGACERNGISAIIVEDEVIRFTKKLVKNRKFAEDIQNRIGQSVDVGELENELSHYKAGLSKIEKSKENLERDIDNIADSDKYAQRKREDMNKRLNKIYDEIYHFEDSIIQCEEKIEAVQKESLNLNIIYNMLLMFDEVFDSLDEADRRELIQSMISEIRLYPKEEWGDRDNVVKMIKYAFPVDEEVIMALRDNQPHVETVILLNRKSI